jgi:hypothetical protein
MKTALTVTIALFAIFALGFTGQNDALAQGSIAGVVINEEGDPVEGAQVMIRSLARGRGVQRIRELTSTDVNGQFGFGNVVAGSYVIQATFEDVGMDFENIEVADDQEVHIQLQIQCLDGDGEGDGDGNGGAGNPDGQGGTRMNRGGNGGGNGGDDGDNGGDGPRQVHLQNGSCLE